MTNASAKFTRYQVFMVVILSVLQFSVVLDFMVLSPLGTILIDKLSIKPSQFALVVSAYAISAGLSGLLAAGFADKFDRKKLLLFFYTGFIIGTLLCGIADTYEFLLGARIITGIFGGVISSISFAIITDIFSLEQRGRVMGFVQMSFAASQVLGLPIGMYLANNLGWHSPFMMIVGISVVFAFIVIIYMKPITTHLGLSTGKNAFGNLWSILSKTHYLKAFAATVLLATGGFMLMPFGSRFSTNNMGLTLDQLPMLYFCTGLFSLAAGPLAGKLSDKIGKYKVFVIGSIIAMIMVGIYCNLSVTPL